MTTQTEYVRGLYEIWILANELLCSSQRLSFKFCINGGGAGCDCEHYGNSDHDQRQARTAGTCHCHSHQDNLRYRPDHHLDVCGNLFWPVIVRRVIPYNVFRSRSQTAPTLHYHQGYHLLPAGYWDAMLTHFSALVYLDDVVRSLSLLNGSALSVFLATSLIVGNI